MVHGNLTGLKPADIRRLERLYRRKIRAREVVSAEAARALTAISGDINRQVGLIIDRRGRIAHVVVGHAGGLFLPDLKEFPLGNRMLRGVRLVHTHLKEEPLTRDDLTDLALLRLDAVAAVGVTPEGLPGKMHLATLLAGTKEGKLTDLHPVSGFHEFQLDFLAFVKGLEEEMNNTAAAAFAVEAGSERATLVSVSTGPKYLQEDSMDELAELAISSNLVVVDRILQRPAKVNPRHLLGRGKLEEMIIRAMQLGSTVIVFDQDLSPGQGKRITDATELKVIDRSQLILDIFARRAHSREGKVQVELAQLKYRLPRLTGRGTAMSRLMGGIGGRGPGEMKLEIDRRRVRDRITGLEKELKSIGRSRSQRKARRARAGIPIVSIVGYTNAGKSTLLNALTASAIHTEAKMFATLDTSSRRLRFPRERDIIITDTVGFIRNLPKDLFNAFKATLEEMEDADLLLHVVDAANPRFEQHIESVNIVLEQIGLAAKEVLVVFNKADVAGWGKCRETSRRHFATCISALDSSTLTTLLDRMQEALWPRGQSLEEP